MQKKRKDTASRRRVWSLVVVALMLVGATAIAFPPQDRINQGLDIQGGLSVVLSAKTDDGQAPTQEEMDKSKSIIEQRVNALGASEASVQKQGDDQILVQIPGMSDSQQALDTIGKTGKLEFARLDSFTDETVKNNIENGQIYDTSDVKEPYKNDDGATFSLNNYKKMKHITVEEGTYTPLFTGDHITKVTVDKASQTGTDYAVNVSLDSEAAKAFATATQELVADKGKIVIIIDGEVNSAPAVQSAITDGNVSITGGYSIDDAKSLQTVLESGSLPVSFTYEQAQTVGPTLGQGELQAGVIAMLLGIALVILYLLIFYKGFGLITMANMVIFAVIYMGVLGTLSFFGLFSLSLAGIAGIILSIGMAADSSILVIERFKEELKEGRSMKAASISGVKHAIRTSIDADVVSAVSALTLFFLASSSVKGFGLTLALGIVCDIIVMLMFKAPIVRLLAPRVMRNHPGFWGLKYSVELGDVRAGTSNYMTPDEVKESNKEHRELRDKDKEEQKKRAEKERARKKETDKRAKEIRKETAKREKEKEERRKEAEKLAEQRKKEAAKREKQREKEMRSEKKHEKRTDKLDKQKSVTDGTESALDSVTEIDIVEERSAEKHDVDHSNIKAHTADEIADLIADANKVNTPSKYKKQVHGERVAGSDDYTLSGPNGDIGYSAAENNGKNKRTDGSVFGQSNAPHMNRAQRRAAAKQNKKKQHR